jgi:hypothetical protein
MSRTAALCHKGIMQAILKTNDAVLLSFAQSLMADAGIVSVVFDTHASIMDGSIGMLPRRLMVDDDDFERARAILREAVPGAAVEL